MSHFVQVMLPEAMPAQFQSTYTPIAAAGTDAQIKHISRLLATQLTMAGMGKGVGELKLQVSLSVLCMSALSIYDGVRNAEHLHVWKIHE